MYRGSGEGKKIPPQQPKVSNINSQFVALWTHWINLASMQGGKKLSVSYLDFGCGEGKSPMEQLCPQVTPAREDKIANKFSKCQQKRMLCWEEKNCLGVLLGGHYWTDRMGKKFTDSLVWLELCWFKGVVSGWGMKSRSSDSPLNMERKEFVHLWLVFFFKSSCLTFVLCLVLDKFSSSSSFQ